MRKFHKKSLAVVLSVVMLLSMLPVSAFAAVQYTESEDDYYKVISKKDWELAPGISESEIVLNNDAGSHRQVAHVVEVDIHNEYTKVIPSSKGMTPTPGNYGVQTMDKQIAYAEENGYGNVVAGMNISLSWYNDEYYSQHPELVGEPLGYMILDGVQYTNSRGKTSGAQTCLVINFDEKDGVARPADIPKTQIRSTADAITGWEEQVIPANFGFLVKNGVNQYAKNHTTDPASRSFVGIKADGTIVMVMNDGRQSPYSAGFNSYEMADFMISLGCVQAVNGDGGGSSQFFSQRPGEDMALHCNPSDGGLRDTTHGILVITTAPSTDEFVRAEITTENEYYTPGSQVEFDAIATNLVGELVDMPEDITWQLEDTSFGTITDDGLFTSNGTVGTVNAQLVYQGKVMGEKEVGMVWPTDFAFSSDAMTVPFGKTVPIDLVVTYNGPESYVALKDGDVTFQLSDATLGTINGFEFTANADENVEVTSGNLTATINGLSDVVTITLGKGSEVIFDFEDDNAKDGWFIYDYNVTHSGNSADPDWDMKNELIEVVTPETGKVHSGDSALAVTVDYSDAYSNGWLQYRMGYEGEYVEIKNAKKIGFWIWMPEEAYANEWDLHIRCIDKNGAPVRLAPVLTDIGYCVEQQDEAGWRYFTADLTAYPIAYFGVYPDADVTTSLSYVQFYNYQQTWQKVDEVVNTQGKFTYFIDDITIEYSDAADDTDAPVFGTPNLVDSNSLLTEINGQTINYNNISVEVTVADFVKANSTGINASSAKAYVDGKEVECAYSNGRIAFSDVAVNDGLHTVKFEISDNMGNMNSVVRQFTVAAGSNAPTVKLVPHDETLTEIKCGSVYYVDLVASDIGTTKKINVDLDLVNTFDWELAYANVADGFELSYNVEKYENIATITLTRTGDVALSGEQVVASIPVRVWEPSIERGNIAGAVLKELWLTINAKKGVLECTDGAVWTFTCDPMKVATEMWMNQWNAPSGFTGVTLHKHTAEAIEDKAVTCTEAGYTGRTYCNDCASVIDWGTVTPATGHSYSFVDGTLKCACGKLYNGIYEDGKTYVDGLVIADGWVDNTYYYLDGVKLTGPQFIDGTMYTFNDDGVYQEKAIFEGFYETRDGKMMYFISNNYVTGLTKIGEKHYIFDDNGYGWEGIINLCGYDCTFEDGLFVEDDTVLFAGTCGKNGKDNVVYVMLKDGRMIFDGEGETEDFNNVGLIPWYAWELRAKMTSVYIGKDITTIGTRLLYNLDHVTKVVFERGSELQKIKAFGMGMMVNLKTVDLPEGLQFLYGDSFKDNTALTSVTIPKSVSSIAATAFNGADNVTFKVLEGTYAHNFAVNNGIDYTIPVVDDVNDDATVNLKDLVTIARYMADWDNLDGINTLALDVDGNGVVNLADLTCLARRMAGWNV